MKLQNHFTTIEQSKKLLELGVPKNTADLYAIARFQKGKYSRPQVLNEQFTQVEARINKTHPNYDIIPIWSVGRLMEITDIYAPHHIVDWTFDLTKTTYIEGVILLIEALVEEYNVDYSKWEERL